MKNLTVLSFGAGVQSTALLWMVLHKDERLLEVTGGVLPRCAIFADTHNEPEATYGHVGRMKVQCAARGFDLRIVSHGNLADAFLHDKRAASIPVFTDSDRTRRGQLWRNCTRDYKINMIHKQARELLGLRPRQWWKGHHLHTWVGISTDEIERMKESGKAWETRHHPLIDLNWSRDDCKAYMESIGEGVPPKSACVMCPYHTNAFWRDMKENHPADFERACQFDEQIRDFYKTGRLGVQNALYVHSSLKPLRTAEFSSRQMDMFDMIAECDGMCGV